MKMSLLALLALLGGGCASRYLAAADREGWSIAAEKTAVVDRFRKSLVDPTQAAGAARKPVPSPIEVPEVVTLDDAIRIATRYNRSYQTRRESFFLTALSLGLTRRDFLDWVWSGNLSWNGSDGRRVDLAETTALALSGTHFLPTGGRLTISSDSSLGSSALSDKRVQSASLSGTITFTQPLLRGAGHTISFEGLTQAERSAVYAARDYELFRQTFAISIIERYYRLVSQKRGIKNIESRVKSQEFLLNQAKALYTLEMGTQQDVFRAERDFRNARNDLLDAQQAYELALDGFKIELGLPLDVSFEIGDEFPSPVPFDVGAKAAVAAALANRLDFATDKGRLLDAQRQVHIARNSLLPDVNLNLAYTTFSDPTNSFRDLAFHEDRATFGISIEIPLDRKAERNAYRASLISLDQARRNVDESRDRIILEIRDSLRRLRQEALQIENDEARIKTITRLVRKADLDNRAGIGSNRDVTEAINQLSDAKNGLDTRYVSYTINRLNLIQRMGLLFVDKNGEIVE